MSNILLAIIGTLVTIITMIGFSVFELQRTASDYGATVSSDVVEAQGGPVRS
jgi:hypothetical protein